ncbi:TamB, inner membrane protein subunit of TAM complex [Carex littledalei]|uniref:TamB, inner membrane protein subunit of TAM complex n=1 Tax=Carex littledalei TaxID=544730 RepID=A0A833QXZ7_9POAL|nr:TamB, inner membrane protein subunit of TAM complex [Carex littledalei]
MSQLLASPLFFSPLPVTFTRTKHNTLIFPSSNQGSNIPRSLFKKPNSSFNFISSSRGVFRVHCTREPFEKTRSFINSLHPVWKEGLFIVRCSVAVAVISVAGLLVWYARLKAQRFAETKLLPSVCSILSEYLQREIDFGKVRSISPLGITLQSCSVGPHREEFSCGEVEVVKLRIRPFASLRQGKIVINAFVSQPCLLVSQKKDFSWLGIPPPSEISYKRNSDEEGIDHRTKSRRVARETATAQWAVDRDSLAREAAENGYVLPKRGFVVVSPEDLPDSKTQNRNDFEKSSEHFCMDQEMHSKDSRIVDGSRHTDLEKSFGFKTRMPVSKFWAQLMPDFARRNFKRNSFNKVCSENSSFSQQMILRRSSLAGLRYFKRLEKKIDSSHGSNLDARLAEIMADKPEKPNHRSDDNSVHKVEKFGSLTQSNQLVPFWPFTRIGNRAQSDGLEDKIEKSKSVMGLSREEISAELTEGLMQTQAEGIEKALPVTVDSIYFTGGTLMLLGYGDQEPREMRNANGFIKFQNHYNRIHVNVSGNCMEWRQDQTSQGGGHLSTDVFVDISEQKWHANLNVSNLFAPLVERILDIPATLAKGRASGEVHICMSKGDAFPSIHGHLDVKGVSFHVLDAPSSFSDLTGNLIFRGQRVFLHNTSGWFGAVPLEASGDFGINPMDGEYHIMCQVPSVELNALMKTLRMRPLMFPVAGSVTAILNCQGPLDAPIFVGSGIMSRKSLSVSTMPPSVASEAVLQNKEAGAVAAFDRIPFSHVSANFTYNLDNCVADLYGIRASLLGGGEIRGAGNAWVCPEGEVDEAAMDINLSGSFLLDKVLHRYIPGGIPLIPLKVGEINGDTRLSGALLRPKFDIKWAAPNAEDSFTDARGNIIISHDYITVNSSSVAFDLNMQVQTSYIEDYLSQQDPDATVRKVPLAVEGLDLDLRMRGFELASFFSMIQFDSPRPHHLKATGRVKFQGKVVKSRNTGRKNIKSDDSVVSDEVSRLAGEISLTGIKLNQLTLAPQSTGFLSISRDSLMLNVSGRPDENISVEVMGPLSFSSDNTAQKRKVVYLNLHKGQLKVTASYHPETSTSLEVRNLPLDELELASLRGIIQKGELQLNFQKRRGHGLLSVLRPKFSGLLGEALDLAARWSGDVITLEKTVLQQASSRYEIQGEYVLPGTRERGPQQSRERERGDGLIELAMAGHLSSVMSSVGRWRLRLEVPFAEVAEMLPLARLLSRSTDPAVRSRSKELFMQGLQSVGFCAQSLHDQLKALEALQTIHHWSDDVILEDMTLPGLAELKGRWQGSLDASGGGNGDTLAYFDFHGEDWEWGTYKTQRVSSSGAYSNNEGLRLDKFFIQKDNATLHADGTLLGPVSNLHFAVLNLPVGLVPTVAQIIESNSSESVHNLRQWLAPVRGILHMEGDLKGTLARPECDVQIRLLDGTVGGIDLAKAELLASVTPASRLVFSVNFEPVVQSGHVQIQGSLPVTYIESDSMEEENDKTGESTLGIIKIPVLGKESGRGGSSEDMSEKRLVRDGKVEEGWEFRLAESLKGLNWNTLDPSEVRVNADIKDGGMMLLTALSPYANWLHGYADILLEVTGTVEHPVVDGSASFHRASISSPVLRKPLTNFGGLVNIVSNRLCITSMESRVSRKGKISLKGNLPLTSSESSAGDKLELKCEVLEVLGKNVLSGQVDSQLQVSGSILQPIISGMVRLSHGEAYLPHDKGNGALANRLASTKARYAPPGYDQMMSSGNVSRFLRSLSTSSASQQSEVEKSKDQESTKPNMDVRLANLKLIMGPELRIVYPLILNFAVSGELDLDGMAHPKGIKPKGILTFENGEINLVATQVRLKRDHLNIAKFEPDLGLDPILDLVLVGTEWQFRIQSRGSTWQDNLVVTSTRSVDQDAAKVFETQLAESLLEGDGQLAFKKLATATLETLMPRIEGKGEFGQARWRLVYAPQIPSLLSLDPTVDPLKSLANNISFATEVEIQLGKRLQASVVRQMKDSEMAMQWTLIYQLTSRLRVLYQSTPSNRFLFEYSATSQD